MPYYLSLQEVSATQSGQRQFKAIDTEYLDGYTKVAQYATHFVELDDAKKVDVITKIPSTFTFFTLFENAASPYYVGPASRLRAAEGNIFLREIAPGSFKLLEDFCPEATHFMTVLLATACELQMKSVGSVFPAEFLSVFKKNAAERAVLRPIAAFKASEDNAPARVPRFVISLQKSVEDPSLLLLMPILTLPTAPNAKCDYYLEGHDQKQMALLVGNLRWNSRIHDFRFTEEDIKKVVSDLKVDAVLHAVAKVTETVDVSDNEEVTTFHAAAQIIAEVANTAAPSNVATEAEIAEVQQAAIDSNIPEAAESSSPASPPPELFDTEPETPPENEVLYVFLDYNSKSDVLAVVRKMFGPINIADFTYDYDYYIRFPEFGDGLQFFELNYNKWMPRSELEADLDNMFPGTSGIQEICKFDSEEEYDSEEEKDLENERLDLQFTQTILEAAQQKKTVDDEPDENQQSSDDSGSEFEEEDTFYLSMIEHCRSGVHNLVGRTCFEIAETIDFTKPHPDATVYARFTNLVKCRLLYSKMRTWSHIGVEAFKTQLEYVAHNDISFHSKYEPSYDVAKYNGPSLWSTPGKSKRRASNKPKPNRGIRFVQTAPKDTTAGCFSGRKPSYVSVNYHKQPAAADRSVDDQIVDAVLEVASRKRTDRCSDETPVSQPKRARRPRRSEFELLRC